MDGLTIIQCGHEECPADKKAERTICRFHMLHFIVKGKGEFNGTELHANQAFLCREGTVNRWRPDPEDPWEYFWFNASGVIADRLLNDCFGENNYIDFVAEPDLMKILNMAWRKNNEFRAGLFIAILGLLSYKPEKVELPLPESHIRSAEELIMSTSGKISAAELAAELGLSRAYLYNIFKKFRGKSVSEYLLDYRMRCACELLASTNYPIQLVAASVGYNDQFCFSKIFHAKTGRSPSEYRKFQKDLRGKFAAKAFEERQT